MKKRNLIMVVIYSLLTLGIYYIYWLISVRRDLNKRNQAKIPTIWILVGPLLGIFVLAMLLDITAAANSSGTPNSATFTVINILVVLGSLASIPLTFYWLWKFSKGVEEYTNKELSSILVFVLMWLVGIIGAAILQNKFNDMLDAHSAATASNTPSEPPKIAPAA